MKPFRTRTGRWSRRFLVLAAVLMALWLARVPLMRALGNWLIEEDPLAQADAIVVLGGAPIERAPVGSQLLRAGWAPRLLFTGGITDERLQLYGIARTEAALGLDAALLDSAQRGQAVLLEVGTSTQEEAIAVRDFAVENSLRKVIVVTTEFHTRRAGKVFRKALAPAGVEVLVRAAPGKDYDAARWWESEAGMIMVNNECMKTLYYALKH
ncbi:MAG: YdcF family protein [Flavobacteriales bacterium]|nr:YdcF family protein [Flavobacteriales bacterium]